MDIPCFICDSDKPKSGLTRGLGDCLQSRNVLFGTSGDFYRLVTKKWIGNKIVRTFQVKNGFVR